MGLVQEAPARRQNLLTSALAFGDASKKQRSDALSNESPPGVVILEPLRPAVVQALQGALDACLHLRRSLGNLRSQRRQHTAFFGMRRVMTTKVRAWISAQSDKHCGIRRR